MNIDNRVAIFARVALTALVLAGCPHDFTRRPRDDGPVDLQSADRPPPRDRGADLAVDGSRDLASEAAAADALVDAGPDLPATDGGCPSPCVTTLTGIPGKEGHVDGPADVAAFYAPAALAVGPKGELYVSDASNNRIRRVLGGQVSTFAGSGAKGMTNGPSLQASFDQPEGIASTASGTVVVADANNYSIRSIVAGSVTTLAGIGIQGFKDGPATSAQFGHPRGVAVDSSGSVLVADWDNNRIRRISAGTVSTFAGSGIAGSQDGSAQQAQFDGPADVAIDAAGQAYVVDTLNNVIRKVVGGQVTTLAGSGWFGYKDGPAAQASFASPIGIAVNSAGDVFVADYYNDCIRRISGGQVTTYAGSGTWGHLDGPASAARFYFPEDVVVDEAGVLYVADTGNDCVRQIK